LLQGASLGTLDAPAFAPATGYISFFTLALYVAGLLLMSFASNDKLGEASYTEQIALRDAILEDGASQRIIEESREKNVLKQSESADSADYTD
jgi:hypothetical protein